jgi:hypothetical protein
MGEHDARESTYRVPPFAPANGFNGLKLSIHGECGGYLRLARMRHGWCCSTCHQREPSGDSLATPLSAEREFVYAYLDKDYLGIVLARGVRDAGAG